MSDSLKKIELNLRCRSCIFFRRCVAPGLETRCSKAGIAANGLPCPKFSLDTTQLNFEDASSVELAKIVSKVPDAQLQAIACMLLTEHKTRQHGFRYGQVIVFNIHGEDRVHSYMKARVTGVSRDGEYLYVSGVGGFLGTLVIDDSIMTLPQWKKKRAQLVKQKRIKLKNKPNLPQRQTDISDTDAGKLESHDADKLNKLLAAAFSSPKKKKKEAQDDWCEQPKKRRAKTRRAKKEGSGTYSLRG